MITLHVSVSVSPIKFLYNIFVVGVIWNYCFINLTWWWFLHVCCIFWKMMFPFHARACQHRHTYIHITLLIAGLVLPISSIVAAFASGGYSVSGFPPLLCVVKDQTAEYYSMWLVINLLLIAGITMLIAMTWRVHKVNTMIGLHALD